MLEFRNVSFKYKDSEQGHSLSNINLSIKSGEVVLLCGKSGCGKTSITRLINGLIPHYFAGQLTGDVLLMGKEVAKQPIQETAKKVGSVFQNPRSQFFNIDTTSEVVFGCENMGMDIEEMEHRLVQITGDFNMQNLLNRSLFKLSGGEKQKIACASVSMPHPEVLVLDEPTSNLDWTSIQSLVDIISNWKKQGKIVVIAEHRLSYLKDVVDRVIYMENSRILEDMTSQDFWKLMPEKTQQRGLRSLYPVDFSANLHEYKTDDNIVLCDFYFHYKNGAGIDIPRLCIPKGAIVGIVGRNGAGKTTFARCLCGLEKKAKGELKLSGRGCKAKHRLKKSYLVMQDVNHQLFTESVREEVLLSIEKDEDECRGKVADEIIASMDLNGVSGVHPLSLSGGQKQRVAIGSAIASEKSILVFDEPTSGLDYHHMLEVANNLVKLSSMGKTIFIISHDPELIYECCNYFVFMVDGDVAWSGSYDSQNAEMLNEFFMTREKSV